MDTIQPRGELLARRAALEAEVAELRSAVARAEQRVVWRGGRELDKRAFYSGLLGGMVALIVLGGMAYWVFARLMSMD